MSSDPQENLTQEELDHQLVLKYKDLLDRTNDIADIGTWDLDLQTQQLTWSLVTKRIHEVGLDFVPDLDSGIEFYPEGEHRTKITQLVNDAIEHGENFDTEIQIVTAKNRLIWVRTIGISEIHDGKSVRLYGLFQNIDKQKQALETIKLQEQFFRQTFENATTGMALVGLDRKWIRLNDQAINLFGYSREELDSLTFKDLTHPEDIDNDLANLEKLVKGEIKHFQVEKRYIKKNKSIVWALLSGSLVRDSQGKPVHFIAQITDITETKKAQENVKSLLDITQKQNERLLNFAHIVSHNLRSHSGNLSMLLNLSQLENDALAQNEYFELFNEASQGLTATIEHLNQVIDVTLQEPNTLEKINLNLALKKVEKNIQGLLKEAKGTLTINLEANTFITGMPAYVDSVLLNLVTNCIKYRSPNRPVIIDITGMETDKGYQISITDNGVGIDLALHGDKIFKLYKTFHGNKDARGVGLFMVKNQIETMDGTISVDSQIGTGSTFYINFKKWMT